MDNNNLVSIIMPAYNSADYIAESINSVINQLYKNWELLIVDDGSTDRTCQIVENYIEKDSRIILLHNKSVVHGAASARNCAIKMARGRYIAYLDSDDLWLENKITEQLKFMKEKECAFSCVSYEVIDEQGNFKGKTVHMLDKVNVNGFLRMNLLQTVGIMIDLMYVNKTLIYMPEYPKTEDAASWIKIMGSGYDCYGIYNVLAQYRRRKKSLSSNKFSSFKWMWNLYRKEAGCSVIWSAYYFIRYAKLAIWKRIPSEKKS